MISYVALALTLTLSKRQNFGHDQIESICRQKINVAQMMISVFDRIEKIVGKGENACCQHFLLFPQHFQKGMLLVGIVW